MGVPHHRYVAKAVSGMGWRVWDRKSNRWWGNYYRDFPDKLLAELNGEKRTQKVVELSKGGFVQKGKNKGPTRLP